MKSTLTKTLLKSLKSPSLSFPIAVAPMIDISTPHYLYMLNMINPHHSQYTEMIHCRAIIRYNDQELNFKLGVPPTKNRVIQLGGSEPEQMARAGKIVEDWGFQEININIGCPSEPVQSGNFGVVLTKDPFLIVKMIESMVSKGVNVPITVKCRIGVDDLEAPGFLENFIRTISYYAPVSHFVIHCRKAWLKGLSPKQNRNIPPLKYDQVYNLIQNFPNLDFTINGGISTIDQITNNLTKFPNLKQVMMGRKFMNQPYFLNECVQATNGPKSKHSAESIFQKYIEYSEHQYELGHRIGILIQPTLNLFPSTLGHMYRTNLTKLLPIAHQEKWSPSKLFNEIYLVSLHQLESRQDQIQIAQAL